MITYIIFKKLIFIYISVPGKLPPRKIAPRLGFGLGLALELGLGGNFPRGQFSSENHIFLYEKLYLKNILQHSQENTCVGASF